MRSASVLVVASPLGQNMCTTPSMGPSATKPRAVQSQTFTDVSFRMILAPLACVQLVYGYGDVGSAAQMFLKAARARHQTYAGSVPLEPRMHHVECVNALGVATLALGHGRHTSARLVAASAARSC